MTPEEAHKKILSHNLSAPPGDCGGALPPCGVIEEELEPCRRTSRRLDRDETFCEEMSEWVDSPEGQLWLDMSDTLEVPLKHVGPRCPTTQIPLA